MIDRIREAMEEVFRDMSKVGVDGLRMFYPLGDDRGTTRWVRPRAMTLAKMQRAIGVLARAGEHDEAVRLRDFGRAKFGPDAPLSREDAMAMMAKALGVPVTELLE